MRVTQSMMFNNMNRNINSIMSDSMESNMQGATQKRVNRPSDDPAASIKILSYRASLASTEQYIDNSSDADAWLKSTDSALQQTQVILSRVEELAIQASSGTMTDENRLAVSHELNQLFDQLINLSNTEFAGNHLFSGHKTGGAAYDSVLGITTKSPELDDVGFKVDGAIDRTVMVRFPDDGEVGGAADMEYEFSKDGGKTWSTKTLAAGETTLDLDGSQVNFQEGVPVNVKGYNDLDGVSPDNGTVLYVRPTAEYKGDDNDAPPEVDVFGEGNITDTKAAGGFSSNVQIRFDSDAKVNSNGTLDYSYSDDNGLTWKTGQATTSAASDSVRIIVDGGYVDVKAGGDGTLNAGQQLVIRPNRASDLGYEISADEFLDVTNSGKDIFGGVYKGNDDKLAQVVEGPNIFESISDLIAWTETNNSDGCGEALDTITEASEQLLTQLAKVGGKANRVSLNISILQSNTDDQKSRMSSLEDIDIGTLTIKMSKEKMALEAVLKSSGLIMNMSLMDYI